MLLTINAEDFPELVDVQLKVCKRILEMRAEFKVLLIGVPRTCQQFFPKDIRKRNFTEIIQKGVVAGISVQVFDDVVETSDEETY